MHDHTIRNVKGGSIKVMFSCCFAVLCFGWLFGWFRLFYLWLGLGMIWFGLAWLSLVWFGLVCFVLFAWAWFGWVVLFCFVVLFWFLNSV